MLHQGTRWVMRVSRLRACQDEAGLDRFVAAFEERQLTASPSRLSRWEYGRSGSSHRLLRAYEEGTGLPAYLLFALNDRRRRAVDDSFAATATFDVTESVSADDVYEILDRVVLGRQVTGSNWYALAAYVSSHGYFYLSPSNTRLIARRLLDELARSIGAGYILRFEALHLLASMARVDDAMVEELLEMITTDGTGMLGDAVSLILRPEPAIARVMAKKLRAGESPGVRQGCTWIEDILRDRTPAQEPPAPRAEVSARRDLLCGDLPAWAAAHLESDVTKPLIDAALGGRSRLRRHEASLVLMTAGLQSAIGTPLLDAFEDEDDQLWRTRLAQLHEYLIPPDDPARVEALALAEVEPEIRRALWNARAHSPEPIKAGPGVLAQLADPEARDAIATAIGLTESIDEALLERADLADIRDVLIWWDARGPALSL